MNFEGVHLIAKRFAAAINGMQVEFQILNKQDELQQLSSEFPHHFELYNAFLHPKKPKEWKLEGSKRGLENWTTPTFSWVHCNPSYSLKLCRKPECCKKN